MVNIQLNQLHRPSHEEMIRKRYIQQIEREKEQLEHKLGYIENTLQHYDRNDYLKKKESGYSPPGKKREQWRREHQEVMKQLEAKKKEISEKNKEREEEQRQAKARVEEEERKQKRKELE